MADAITEITVAVIHLLEKLVWPTVLLIILSRFRLQIRSLLTKLATMKVGGTEFTFQHSVNSPPNNQEIKSVLLNIGPDGFLTTDTLKALVENSSLITSDQHVKSLLQIFQTPEQRTWLVATNDFVFILLDDESTRKGETIIQNFFESEKTLPVKFKEVNGSGIVNFGADKNWWYYSLHLFPTTSSLQEAIHKLIAEPNV